MKIVFGQSTVPPLRSSLATAEIPCWLRLLIYFNVVRRAFKQRLNIAHKMELGTKTCQFFSADSMICGVKVRIRALQTKCLLEILSYILALHW